MSWRRHPLTFWALLLVARWLFHFKEGGCWGSWHHGCTRAHWRCSHCWLHPDRYTLQIAFFFFFNQHLTYLWQESISGSQGASGPMKVVKRSVSIPRCILHLRYLRILLNAASEVLSYLASSSPWSRKTRTLYPSWALISNFDWWLMCRRLMDERNC